MHAGMAGSDRVGRWTARSRCTAHVVEGRPIKSIIRAAGAAAAATAARAAAASSSQIHVTGLTYETTEAATAGARLDSGRVTPVNGAVVSWRGHVMVDDLRSMAVRPPRWQAMLNRTRTVCGMSTGCAGGRGG